MRSYYAVIFLFVIFASSCSKDGDGLFSRSSKTIVFDKMKVGQKSQYVLLKGEDYKNPDNIIFEYAADTMVIEIVAEDENGFIAEEYLTAGSASLNGEYHVAFPENIFTYYFNIKDNQLTIVPINEREISRVFFLEDNSLPLEKNHDLEVSIEGWKTSLPYKAQYFMAHVKDYSLFDKAYDFLNVMINNEKMDENQPGYTHIYAPNVGLVRSSQYSPETNKGFGWDLLW